MKRTQILNNKNKTAMKKEKYISKQDEIDVLETLITFASSKKHTYISEFFTKEMCERMIYNIKSDFPIDHDAGLIKETEHKRTVSYLKDEISMLKAEHKNELDQLETNYKKLLSDSLKIRQEVANILLHEVEQLNQSVSRNFANILAQRLTSISQIIKIKAKMCYKMTSEQLEYINNAL